LRRKGKINNSRILERGFSEKQIAYLKGTKTEEGKLAEHHDRKTREGEGVKILLLKKKRNRGQLLQELGSERRWKKKKGLRRRGGGRNAIEREPYRAKRRRGEAIGLQLNFRRHRQERKNPRTRKAERRGGQYETAERFQGSEWSGVVLVGALLNARRKNNNKEGCL